MDINDSEYYEKEASDELKNVSAPETPQEKTNQPDAEENHFRSEPVQNNRDSTGYRRSPFADSPYQVNPQQEQREHQTYSSYDMPPRKKQKNGNGHSRKVWKRLTAAVLAIGLMGGSCAATAAFVNHHWEKKTQSMEQTMNQKISDIQKRLNSEVVTDGVSNNVAYPEGLLTPSQVYSQNVNSVVAISNQGITKNIYGQISRTASSGTGFIITSDGYIVSNYHVVEGAETLNIITFDGTEYSAELIGFDKANDISLLKVDAKDLIPVTIGSSDDLIVGDQVVAIGNPLGELTSTLTVGYISAKDRTISTDSSTSINMMQTDAAINPGNSGGPLFNMKGEVIGITTAKYSSSGSSGTSIEGIGFAIPIDDVIGMVGDLKEHGYITGAHLGISVISLDQATAELYSLPAGSLVESVVDGSCSEKAGVHAKDIIIGLGSYDVTSNSDLMRALRKFKAGDTTTITVYRGGSELDLTITLDEKPAPDQEETQPIFDENDENMPNEGSAEEWFKYFAPYFKFRGR